MAKNKFPGLYWDKETGKGAIDIRIEELGRVRHRFSANTWQEAEAEYHRAVAAARTQAAASRFRTFREAATKYLNEETKSSLARDADCLANLDSWIGSLRLDQIHQGSLQSYIEHRREQGVKSATVVRELAVVRRILTLGSRVWRDQDNQPWLPVAPLLRMPDWKDAAKPYPLSVDEQRRFFKELPDHLAEMALLALHTGLRDQEICGMRWDHEARVNELDTSVFIITENRAKNDYERIVPLNMVARSIIAKYRGQCEYVFNLKGNRLDRMNNRAWRKARMVAGLTDVRVHDLRHTFGMRLRAAGVSFEDRQDLLGASCRPDHDALQQGGNCPVDRMCRIALRAQETGAYTDQKSNISKSSN